MKKICAILFLLAVSTKSFAQITFQKAYGATSTEQGISCQQTNDGGYVAAGDGEAWGNAYLVRTDTKGNLLWAKNYSFSGATYSEVRHVLQTSDGGFLI